MNHNSNSPARAMAFCGVCCALALVFMLMGNLPFAAYCAPLIASVVLLPILVQQGEKMAWISYGAVALLALFLCGDRECSLLFLVLGYYPILKFRHLEYIRSRGLRIAVQLLLFNAAIFVMYGLLLLLMGGGELAAGMLSEGWLFNLIFVLLANFLMLLYDKMLERVLALYLHRLAGGKIRFGLRKKR